MKQAMSKAMKAGAKGIKINLIFTEDLALVNPNLNAYCAEGRMRGSNAVFDVGAQSLKSTSPWCSTQGHKEVSQWDKKLIRTDSEPV